MRRHKGTQTCQMSRLSSGGTGVASCQGNRLVRSHFRKRGSIQRPTTELAELREHYEYVLTLNENNRRERGSDQKLIQAHIQYIEPVPLYSEREKFTEMGTVFETFRTHKADTFFPITNGNGEPVGIIRERDLKEYVYSPYGRDILKNKSCGNILNFITRLPISEINTRVEKILELFAIDEKSEGIPGEDVSQIHRNQLSRRGCIGG